MKNVKKMFAITIAVVMLFSMVTVSFATELDYTNTIKISAVVSPAQVEAGESFTVTYYIKDVNADDGFIKLAEGGDIGWSTTVNSEAVTYVSGAAGLGLKSTDIVDKLFLISSDAEIEVKDTDVLGVVTYKVNDGVEPGTYEVVAIEDPSVANYVGGEAGDYEYTNPQITVVAAAAPEPTKYTVTFDTAGGSEVASQEVAEGEKAEAPAAPTRDGFTFIGWVPAISETVIDKDTTFKAQWEKNAEPFTGEVITNSADFVTVTIGENKYYNIFEGIYTIEPNGAAVSKFGVNVKGTKNPSDVREFKSATLIETEGKITFRFALIGLNHNDGIDAAKEIVQPFAE